MNAMNAIRSAINTDSSSEHHVYNNILLPYFANCHDVSEYGVRIILLEEHKTKSSVVSMSTDGMADIFTITMFTSKHSLTNAHNASANNPTLINSKYKSCDSPAASHS
jgi:hypothetical protein